MGYVVMLLLAEYLYTSKKSSCKHPAPSWHAFHGFELRSTQSNRLQAC